MFKYPCPSCGGELVFRSSLTLFTVCPYCRSSVIRSSEGLEKIGEMAELQADLSPIQIGTTGKYKNKNFYVAGRVIYQWEDGLWNEWYLLFNDGKSAWLAEAQGEFAISFALNARLLPIESDLETSKIYSINDENFRLIDTKAIIYAGSEGELPFKAEAKYRSTVYDFIGNQKKFLSIEYPLGHGTEPLAYLGTYIELGMLKPLNLRVFEGWI